MSSNSRVRLLAVFLISLQSASLLSAPDRPPETTGTLYDMLSKYRTASSKSKAAAKKSASDVAKEARNVKESGILIELDDEVEQKRTTRTLDTLSTNVLRNLFKR